MEKNFSSAQFSSEREKSQGDWGGGGGEGGGERGVEFSRCTNTAFLNTHLTAHYCISH